MMARETQTAENTVAAETNTALPDKTEGMRWVHWVKHPARRQNDRTG